MFECNEHFDKEVISISTVYRISEWLSSFVGSPVDNCWRQAVNVSIMSVLTKSIYNSRTFTIDTIVSWNYKDNTDRLTFAQDVTIFDVNNTIIQHCENS